MLYLDTSALAKLYIQEAGTEEVRGLVDASRGLVFTSIVTCAEALAVLARCRKERRMADGAYRAAKRAFLADWPALHVVGLDERVLAPAERLIESHGLRGFDAVHLCAALWIGRPRFACFDARLRSAAESAGLTPAP
ncbi:MAG: type II toxin-antitoxin system VapC family toxin [Acidobacteria bacterium]|nr:type II toxin-antitoxin system VapC family toxin [Acidobacteriota bacterium]